MGDLELEHPDLVEINRHINSTIEYVLMCEAEEHDKRYGPPAGNVYLWNQTLLAQRAIKANT